MLNKLIALAKKYRSVISYLVFGVLTTAVNYAVYLPLYNYFGFSATVSNVIAWVVAVIVAFLTNKQFVFESKDWSAKTTGKELAEFVACRVGSGLLETLIIYITVDALDLNGNVMKILTSVLVLVINYVGSKLLVFRKRETK